jgi:uncharacterized protein (TIGR03086 family)
MLDLGPAAREMTRLVQGVRDDQLEAATPCPDYTVGDLLEHVHGLAMAFTIAARKGQLEGGARGPSGDASRLPADWRTDLPERLDALVEAWRDPAAWEGVTQIAGFEAPAENVGMTAVNELVVHGWDVARATGQTEQVDEASLEPCSAFAAVLTGPHGDQMRQGGFGEPRPVAGDAPRFERIIAANGRDPQWAAG